MWRCVELASNFSFSLEGPGYINLAGSDEPLGSYRFLAGGSFCFNQRRTASAMALLRAPFSPSYSSIARRRSSLARSSGIMMFSLARNGHLHHYTSTPKRLYLPYYTHTRIHRCVSNTRERLLSQRVSIDAEALELRLAEDRRIQVKTSQDPIRR